MLDWVTDAAEELVENTLSMAESVISLGDQGEFSKDQVDSMVSNGLTLVGIAEASGISLDVLEEFMDE